MSGQKTIHPSGGQFGYTTAAAKNFRIEAEFSNSAAITGPKVVTANTSGNVATAATDATASLCIGVAVNSPGATNDHAKVVVYGIVTSVPATGSVAAGDILKRSATTSGSVSATASPAAGEPIGVALAASASNVVTMLVCKGY